MAGSIPNESQTGGPEWPGAVGPFPGFVQASRCVVPVLIPGHAPPQLVLQVAPRVETWNSQSASGSTSCCLSWGRGAEDVPGLEVALQSETLDRVADEERPNNSPRRV